jgi:lactate dehydrogenase-like 2-hydroxyacid dehydrogenase
VKHDLFIAGPMFGPTLKVLDDTYTTHKLWLAPDKDAFFAGAAGQCTAAATTGGRGMDAALMARLPRLAMLANFGVGTDAIDLAAAKARGIAVSNTPDVLTEDVADLAIALLLATVRRVAAGDRYVRAGKWLEKPMMLTDSLQGRTLGVIGMGRIGKAIARRAEAFKLKIAYQGPNRKPDLAWAYHSGVAALAKECDFLVAACPGGESTRGIIDREAIDALGPKGVIVNISRGAVIDEPELVKALQEGRLGGAGLDVFVDEPRVPEAFFAMDNVVLQPHVGSATFPTREAMGQLVIDNLALYFAGKPLKTPC